MNEDKTQPTPEMARQMANTIVVPGGKMEIAMQLIFTPFIWRMMERRKRALGAH